MRTHELMMLTNQLVDDLQDRISLAVTDLQVGHTGTNEEIQKLADVHRFMSEYVVNSMLASKFKKTSDATKKALDSSCALMGVNPDSIAGQTTKIYENEAFIFTKKQNVDGSQCSATDLVTELNKLGVDPEKIASAVKAATKPRKGNTYYEVSAAG